VLAIRQIEARYPSQWILVKDPLVDNDLRVIKGKVVSHSKDRDEVEIVKRSSCASNIAPSSTPESSPKTTRRPCYER
jgi:hypothetical protein